MELHLHLLVLNPQAKGALWGTLLSLEHPMVVNTVTLSGQTSTLNIIKPKSLIEHFMNHFDDAKPYEDVLQL